MRPPLDERANAEIARSMSPGSRTLTGVNSTPNDGATDWMAPNCPVPAAIAGSRRTATRVTLGAISLRSSSHFAPMLYSNKTKPVALPPGRARLSTKPAPTGSIVPANTYAPLSSNVGAQETTSLQIPMANAVGPHNGKPISIFVSRKLGKLLVRQGSAPLFDAPIKIENRDEPLGTHVFTAMASQNEVAVNRWTVVSVPEEYLNGPANPKSHKQTMKRIIETAPSVPTADKANAAFNRIEIPTDVVERISELLTPGSSLILSDHGLSDETGKDTDFIVETY